VDAIRDHLRISGIEPAHFYFEKFALSGTAAGKEETVRLAGVGSGGR
jgi:hypothetical protein